MLYEIRNATISVGGNDILTGFDFRIVDNEKIALVGKNGTGKTTLLRFIVGEVELDYNSDNSIGKVIKSNDFVIGYLSQISFSDKNITVYEELSKAFKDVIDMKIKIDELNNKLKFEYNEGDAIRLNDLINAFNNSGGLYYEKEIKIAFNKFGFDTSDLNKKLSEFSGGQITKISLLKLLLMKPNLLILDEPTNNLDIDAIEWMEEYFKKYKNTILLVSHDRMFIDNVCNVVYEIENKKLIRYTGNYTNYLEQKEKNFLSKLSQYKRDKKKLDKLNELTERFRYKATKAKMVKSKDKMIKRIEDNLEMPFREKNNKKEILVSSQVESGKVVLRCEDLVVGYGNKSISKVNLLVNRGDRVGIIGKNGTGKSTFIKTIVDEVKKISGVFYFGHNVYYEYFEQNVANINSDDTIFEYFEKIYPSYTNEQIRDLLGKFSFTGEAVFKKVSKLSGGEKVRLTFAKIFEKKPNLLILDEPTNHLDIASKENLEYIIDNYDGTVIFVSHDRYFTKKISNKILLFESGKTLYFSDGYIDYENYENRKNEIDNKFNYDLITSSIYDVKNPMDEGKIDYSEIEPYDKYMSLSEAENLKNIETNDTKKISKESFIDNKEKNKILKKIKVLEENIEKLEKDNNDLKISLNDVAIQTDFQKLYEIDELINKNEIKIDNYLKEWEELNDLIK